MRFNALDVETANPDMSSICQIGIVHFEDGKPDPHTHRNRFPFHGGPTMMPGFVQVDHHTFYADIWLRIKKDVEAVESNWADARKGVRQIVIKWGYKDEKTGEQIILAIIRADDASEEHWVVESLISGTWRAAKS